MKNITKIAFTLAEVLIVLGIIGIIADMTIPTLKRDIDKIVYVTQLKKAYSSLHQAANMTLALEGVSSVDESTAQCQETDSDKCADAAGTWLRTYFRIAADYGEKTDNCFAESYKTVNKTKTISKPGGDDAYTVSLSDGMCISIDQWPGNWTTINIDLNGVKKPNIRGRDLFLFHLYSDGSLAESAPGRDQDSLEALAANCSKTGYGCLSRMLMNGWKMDY